MASDKRVKVTLACEVCKRRNYITVKNKQNDRERLAIKKYCRWDKSHTLHRETPQQGARRMPRNEKRVKVTLACETCKRRNYITMKNKQNDRERIEMKKYCRWDRQHTLHKETR